MPRRPLRVTLGALLGLVLWLGADARAQAQAAPHVPAFYTLNRYYYYPFTWYPWNYWPTQGPKWPEPPGAPYRRPPAYMAYPPFKEPHWRYEWYQGQEYHRGFHFWLDQF